MLRGERPTSENRNHGSAAISLLPNLLDEQMSKYISQYTDQGWRFAWLLTHPVIDFRYKTNLHWQTAKVGARQMEHICLLILRPGPGICMSLLTLLSTKCSFIPHVPLCTALLILHTTTFLQTQTAKKPPAPKAISFLTYPLVLDSNRLRQFPG